MDETDETDKAVAIARQKLREALYRRYSDMDVEGIVDAVVEIALAEIALSVKAAK
jgi:hypothetical protein